MKVWVVVDFDRELDFHSVQVYQRKPNWESDFYEKHIECEVKDEGIVK